jgi:hypothetical protein
MMSIQASSSSTVFAATVPTPNSGAAFKLKLGLVRASRAAQKDAKPAIKVLKYGLALIVFLIIARPQMLRRGGGLSAFSFNVCAYVDV